MLSAQSYTFLFVAQLSLAANGSHWVCLFYLNYFSFTDICIIYFRGSAAMPAFIAGPKVQDFTYFTLFQQKVLSSWSILIILSEILKVFGLQGPKLTKGIYHFPPKADDQVKCVILVI